jgi:hypothetical protein
MNAAIGAPLPGPLARFSAGPGVRPSTVAGGCHSRVHTCLHSGDLGAWWRPPALYQPEPGPLDQEGSFAICMQQMINAPRRACQQSICQDKARTIARAQARAGLDPGRAFSHASPAPELARAPHQHPGSPHASPAAELARAPHRHPRSLARLTSIRGHSHASPAPEPARAPRRQHPARRSGVLSPAQPVQSAG